MKLVRGVIWCCIVLKQPEMIWNQQEHYFLLKIIKEPITERIIAQAEEIRHASDYDDFYIASKEESEQQISVADEFIILAEKYCLEQFKQ